VARISNFDYGFERQKIKEERNAIINEEVGTYGNNEFFVKKATKSKELLRKFGLPKELNKKSQA